MTETKDGEETKTGVSLAFRVVPSKEGLFAHQMLLLRGNEVVEKRTGIYTTLGHAIAAADDIMDGWAFSEIERKAEDYFHEVFL